jgi:hypothetical protein
MAVGYRSGIFLPGLSEVAGEPVLTEVKVGAAEVEELTLREQLTGPVEVLPCGGEIASAAVEMASGAIATSFASPASARTAAAATTVSRPHLHRRPNSIPGGITIRIAARAVPSLSSELLSEAAVLAGICWRPDVRLLLTPGGRLRLN